MEVTNSFSHNFQNSEQFFLWKLLRQSHKFSQILPLDQVLDDVNTTIFLEALMGVGDVWVADRSHYLQFVAEIPHVDNLVLLFKPETVVRLNCHGASSLQALAVEHSALPSHSDAVAKLVSRVDGVGREAEVERFLQIVLPEHFLE